MRDPVLCEADGQELRAGRDHRLAGAARHPFRVEGAGADGEPHTQPCAAQHHSGFGAVIACGAHIRCACCIRYLSLVGSFELDSTEE